MDYFERFDEWNNKYPEQSVTAEQYTYIKSLLEDADTDYKELTLKNINLMRRNTASKGLVTTVEEEYKVWFHAFIAVGIGFIISTGMLYFVIFSMR